MVVEPSVATLQELHMLYWGTGSEVKSMRAALSGIGLREPTTADAKCVNVASQASLARPAHARTAQSHIQIPVIPLPATPG